MRSQTTFGRDIFLLLRLGSHGQMKVYPLFNSYLYCPASHASASLCSVISCTSLYILLKALPQTLHLNLPVLFLGDFFLGGGFVLVYLMLGPFLLGDFFLRRRFSLGILDIETFSFGSFHQNRGLSGSIRDIRTFPDRGFKFLT